VSETLNHVFLSYDPHVDIWSDCTLPQRTCTPRDRAQEPHGDLRKPSLCAWFRTDPNCLAIGRLSRRRFSRTGERPAGLLNEFPARVKTARPRPWEAHGRGATHQPRSLRHTTKYPTSATRTPDTSLYTDTRFFSTPIRRMPVAGGSVSRSAATAAAAPCSSARSSRHGSPRAQSGRLRAMRLNSKPSAAVKGLRIGRGVWFRDGIAEQAFRPVAALLRPGLRSRLPTRHRADTFDRNVSSAIERTAGK